MASWLHLLPRGSLLFCALGHVFLGGFWGDRNLVEMHKLQVYAYGW